MFRITEVCFRAAEATELAAEAAVLPHPVRAPVHVRVPVRAAEEQAAVQRIFIIPI